MFSSTADQLSPTPKSITRPHRDQLPHALTTQDYTINLIIHTLVDCKKKPEYPGNACKLHNKSLGVFFHCHKAPGNSHTIGKTSRNTNSLMI